MLTANLAQNMDMLPSMTFSMKNLSNVSIVVSGWILSVAMLFTYYIKMDSNHTYNQTIKMTNTLNLKMQFADLKRYAELMYANHGDNIDHRKNFYDKLKTIMTLKNKCNLLTFNEAAVPFPGTEIIISLTLIGICMFVIISQNLLNNPFEVLQRVKLMKRSNNTPNARTSSSFVNAVQSLNIDAHAAKLDRIEKLLKVAKTSDNEDDLATLESLKETTQLQLERLRGSTNYKNNASEVLRSKHAQEWGKYEPIYNAYTEFVNETNKLGNNKEEMVAMVDELDDIESIISQYQNALSNEVVFVGGGNDTGSRQLTPYYHNDNDNESDDGMLVHSNQKGGNVMDTYNARLLELENLRSSMMSDDSDNWFVQISVAFTVLVVAISISFSLLNNTLKFKSELFNGKLYGQSMCYN